MAKASSRAFVRMSPRKPHNQWKKVSKGFTKGYKTVVKQVLSRGNKFLRQNIPVSSGRLRDSYKGRMSVNTALNAVINIETTVPYARFVDKGAAPSAGRYVPILDRRIRSGFHPGQRAVNYIKKTENQMQLEANTRLRKLFKKTNKQMRRHFPKGRKAAVVR